MCLPELFNAVCIQHLWKGNFSLRVWERGHDVIALVKGVRSIVDNN